MEGPHEKCLSSFDRELTQVQSCPSFPDGVSQVGQWSFRIFVCMLRKQGAHCLRRRYCFGFKGDMVTTGSLAMHATALIEI